MSVVNAESISDVDAAQALSAPSVRLMKTVAAAIREDLTRVKDVLDIFVRKGATQVEDLAPQLEMLRKISDTLGVLGLGALRTRVEGELESLKGIVERRIAPDDAALLGVAAALIEVEDSLDSQLLRLICPTSRAAPGEPTDEEFRLVQDAVLRECIVNMARIKEAVTQSLSAPAEAQGLDQVPQLVRGITAGLLMLGKQRAVEIMEGVGRALGTIVRPDSGSLAPQRLERLADAIVAIEYYMETLQAGRADQWHMLDGAEARLAEIEPTGRVITVAGQPARAQKRRAASTVREKRRVSTTRSNLPRSRSLPLLNSRRARRAWAIPVQPASAAPAVAATTADPEFVALFVEEARENVARLNELFPRWEQNPLDAEALRDVRRAFHTLKGSGRMVGARRVGEFLLERRVAVEPCDQPDTGSLARHRRSSARGGGGDAAADRRNRRRHDHCGRRRRHHGARRCAVGREATPMPPVTASVPAPSAAPPVVSPVVEPTRTTTQTSASDAEALAAAAAQLAATRPAAAAPAPGDAGARQVEQATMDPVLRESSARRRRDTSSSCASSSSAAPSAWLRIRSARRCTAPATR
jgi:hypothetical protein